MKISIVIATYNRKSVLMNSIRSVLEQTYSDIEIVVVDDGSTDGTEELFGKNKIDSRVLYVRLDKNSGSTVARNRGIEEASGEYIMVWDSDDILYPHALETIMEAFEKNPSAYIVSSPARQIRNEKTIDYRKVDEGVIPLEKIMCKYLPNNEKIRVARADLFKKVKYQSKNIDFMVNVYLAQGGSWYHLSQELGDVILESDATALTVIRKKSDASLSMDRTKHLTDFLDIFGDMLSANCPKRYSAYAYGTTVGLLLWKKKKESLLLSLRAIKNDKFNIKYSIFFIFSLIPFSPVILKFLFYIKKRI